MGGKSSTSTQTVQIPPEVLARYNAVNRRAEGVADRDFARYSSDPADFVAQLSGTQRSGISNINQAYGSADPYFQQAGTYGQGAAQAVNPENLGAEQINKYMNPYMQNVLGSTQAMLNQQNQQAMAGQTGNAIRSGAFGGDRAGIAAANLAQQQNLAAGKIYSDIASQGYNQALQTAAQQQGLGYQAAAANRAAQLAASQNLANIGTGRQAALLQGAQAQLGAGQLEQQTEQAGKTALFNQFMQEQSYPFQVAQFLANIAMGTGALSGSTTTSEVPGGFFSDERLKEDINVIGKTFDGQPIYKYRYKGDDKHQIGLIAQDVEKHHPHAVGLAGGYKTVDYDKATESAEHKGHFASGGLASMGGHVAPEHIGEGYADGGSPTLQGLSPSDMAAILEAQAKMFGPFSSYGLDITGQPHGGVEGYIPQANLPVAGLATASGSLQSPESGLEQAADAAESIGTLAKTYQQGKQAYEDYKNKKENDSEQSKEVKNRGGLAGYADGGSPEDEKDELPDIQPAKPDASGLAAMPTGAAKAPNEGMSKMNIPNESPSIPQLQAPSGASAKDPTMDQMKDIASIAASVAAIAASDKRLKEDIHPIGKTFDGQTVYKYRFKGDPRFQMGLLAQEVEKHHPHAVGEIDGGYKGVNYDKATKTAENRGHFFQGGMPYDQSNGSIGLNIPTGGNQPHQLQTAAAPQQGPTGLQNTAGLADIASSGLLAKEALSKGAEAGAAGLAGAAAPAAAAGAEAATAGAAGAGSGLLGAAFPAGMAGLALGSMLFKKDGGSIERNGYKWGGADDSGDILNQPRFQKDFLLGDKTLDEYNAEKARNQAALQQRDEDINRQLKLYDEPAIKDEDPNDAPFYTVGSDNKTIYHPALSQEGKDINKGLTFGDEQGRQFTLGEDNQRQYVSGSASPARTGLAGASPRTESSSEQALFDSLNMPETTVEDPYKVNPVAEALGDVSQMQTTTPAGATGTGGLGSADAPAVAPATVAPKAGLAAAPAAETKPAGLAAKAKEEKADDGKPAHWYTDPKYIIPLLQGVAAMGTAPTRSWGVALSAGLGQGLKGLQQQRAFELEKQKTGADIKLTEAATLQTKVNAAAEAARARRENIFDAYGERWVNIEGGKTMRYSDWRNMPNPPPLQFSALTTGIELGTDMPLATAPTQAVVKPTATAATSVSQPSGRISPSKDSLGLIEKNAEGNMSSGMREEILRNTVETRKQISDRAATSYSQEPQLTAMASAVSKIPENTVLSGNTLSDFTQSVLLNWNSLVGSLGHTELQIKPDELTDVNIRNKTAAAYQLGIGKNSVEALQTAAATIPTGNMTKDASIAITANMLIDKQRAIDEALYENSIYDGIQNKYGYDANRSRLQFGIESSAIYEEEKNKLIQLLNARSSDGRSIVDLLQAGLTTPEQVDAFMKSPGISRYFVSGRR